ncbi:MAG: hypothetical protein GY708_09975 [Actinomycetia bacterium]|nr:hypothetical protein [Actinomycetes bacterium]
MDESPALSKSERKKARRRERANAERAAAKELNALADTAVERALELAREVADAPSHLASERLIDVPVATPDAARFILKRINDALASGEWLEEVDAWVWESDTSTRPPLSDSGRETGVELRLEQVSPSTHHPPNS